MAWPNPPNCVIILKQAALIRPSAEPREPAPTSIFATEGILRQMHTRGSLRSEQRHSPAQSPLWPVTCSEGSPEAPDHDHRFEMESRISPSCAQQGRSAASRCLFASQSRGWRSFWSLRTTITGGTTSLSTLLGESKLEDEMLGKVGIANTRGAASADSSARVPLVSASFAQSPSSRRGGGASGSDDAWRCSQHCLLEQTRLLLMGVVLAGRSLARRLFPVSSLPSRA